MARRKEPSSGGDGGRRGGRSDKPAGRSSAGRKGAAANAGPPGKKAAASNKSAGSKGAVGGRSAAGGRNAVGSKRAGPSAERGAAHKARPTTEPRGRAAERSGEGPGQSRSAGPARRDDSGRRDDGPRGAAGPRGVRKGPGAKRARNPYLVPVAIARSPVLRGAPLRGDWLFTTRPGAEQDLVDELRVSGADLNAKAPAISLVRARAAPTTPQGEIDLAFARQGFAVSATLEGDIAQIARAAADAIAQLLSARESDEPFTLVTWGPDSDEGNRWSSEIETLDASLRALLDERGLTPTSAATSVNLVQVALIAPGRALVGQVPTHAALSTAPGGRERMRVGHDRPSRAARKVEEALSWLGMAPGAGEVCIDLGAAPGGWSWSLLSRRAKVIAVDPAELRPDVAAHRLMVHVKASAFQYAPDEPVDWLFCDMAWRPLEAAQLLAKFARKGWARMLVANLKLPMKTKAQTLEDLRSVLLGGGWQRLRARQLYHDRDEITVTAYR